MKLQPEKPNTKPIFILARKYQCLTKFDEDRIQKTTRKIPMNFGQIYQIPIWYWYFLGIPNFWFPIDITNQRQTDYLLLHIALNCSDNRSRQVE